MTTSQRKLITYFSEMFADTTDCDKRMHIVQIVMRYGAKTTAFFESELQHKHPPGIMLFYERYKQLILDQKARSLWGKISGKDDEYDVF